MNVVVAIIVPVRNGCDTSIIESVIAHHVENYVILRLSCSSGSYYPSIIVQVYYGGEGGISVNFKRSGKLSDV